MYLYNNDSEVMKLNYKKNDNESNDYDLTDNDEYRIKIANTINKTDEMIEEEKKLTEKLKK